MKMLIALGLMVGLAGCSFKYLQPVDDSETSWRQVEGPAASGAAPDISAPPGY